MFYDVTVVGSGPAGLSAAIELAKSGLSVVVIDEYYRPGGRLLGQLYDDPKAPPAERHWDGKKVAQQLVSEAERLGIHIHCNITSWSVSEGWDIKVAGMESKSITSRVLLLATGAAEKSLPIPGWTLPGVFSVGAAQTFTNVHHISIGKRVIVVGADPLSLSVVMEMKQAGIEVVGVAMPPKSLTVQDELSSPVSIVERLGEVADLAPNAFLRTMGKLTTGKMGKLAAHGLRFNMIKIDGTPIMMRSAVIGIRGNGKVEFVNIQSVTVEGEPVGEIQQLKVDAVCLSAGLYPLVDLVQVAGCPLIDIPELGGLVPIHGPNLQTPVENLYIAGNISGIEGVKVAIAQGKLAATTIAQSLGKPTSKSIDEARNEVETARELSPIKFLPDIDKGRAKMETYWMEYEKEVFS